MELQSHGWSTDFERRASVRRAFRAVQVRALLMWLEATLLTLARASLVGAALVIVYTIALGEALLRARRAREQALWTR